MVLTSLRQGAVPAVLDQPIGRLMLFEVGEENLAEIIDMVQQFD